MASEAKRKLREGEADLEIVGFHRISEVKGIQFLHRVQKMLNLDKSDMHTQNFT